MKQFNVHPIRGILFAICVLLLAHSAQAIDLFEEEPISYSKTKADNPVSQLQEAIDNKSVVFTYDEQFGYLKSLLDALEIPEESQVLVFSKTSFQARYITPATPRAVYFNDESYIGTVRYGEVIEVSTTDPKLGAVFYVLEQEETERPKFIRQGNNCLQCHASTLTRGFPGHVVRSVFPDNQGFPILKAGTHITTQDSPFEKRWGGWYVTGEHGDARHMGNVIATETEHDAEIDMEAGANRLKLDERVHADSYLTSHSDIVALMVLEHQTQMHNMIINANFETRRALRDQKVMDEILSRDPNKLSESTQRRIASAGNKLVDYMLFANEAPLPSPVVGLSGFSETFMQQGPRDSSGRSLRELDLETRMLKYPMSYLIYSLQFDELPEPMKDFVYRRLWTVLIGEDDSGDFDYLKDATGNAIREILIETKPGLPDYWK